MKHLSLALVCLFGGAAAADLPAEKKTTVTYEVADLVQSARAWQRAAVLAPGGPRLTPAGKEAPIDTLSRVIVVEARDAFRAKDDPATLTVVNGVRLQIRTTEKHHQEIADLLSALRRLADCSVRFECELIDVDRELYRKRVEPQLARVRKGTTEPVLISLGEDLEKELVKQKRLQKPPPFQLLHESEGTIFSVRQHVPYLSRVKGIKGAKADGYQSVASGLTLHAQVGITADRRSIDLKLTRTTTEVIELKKEKLEDPATGEVGVIEVPEVREGTASTSLRIEDGEVLLVPVPYRPGAVDKDRVSVLIVRPRIVIEEEERAKGNNPN